MASTASSTSSEAAPSAESSNGEIPIPPIPPPTPPSLQSSPSQQHPESTAKETPDTTARTPAPAPKAVDRHEHRHANGTPATFGRKKSNKGDIYKSQIDVCLFGPERRFYFSKTTPIKGWVKREEVYTDDENNETSRTKDDAAAMACITEDDEDQHSAADDDNPSRFRAKTDEPQKSRLGPSNMENPSLLRDVRSLTSSRRLANVPKTKHLSSPDFDDGLNSRWGTGSDGGGSKTSHVVDLQNLRRLASQGIPDAGSHRGVAWRVLLAFVPTDLAKWEEVLERDRSLYRNLVSELFVSPGEEGVDKSGADEETLKKLEEEEELASEFDDKLGKRQSLRVIEDWDTLKEDMEKRSKDDEVKLEDNQMGKGEVEVSTVQEKVVEGQGHEGEDVSYNVSDICSSTHHDMNRRTTSDGQRTDNSSNTDGSLEHSNDNDDDDEPPPNMPMMSTTRPNFNTITRKPDSLLPARVREHLKSTNSLGSTRSINELLIVDDAGNVADTSSSSRMVDRVTVEDDPLSEKDDSKWKQYFENTKLLDEIRKDVVRTHPDLHFFLEPEDDLGQRRYAALERILFVWAKLNKGVRYVQGMNEIVGTIYFVLATDFNEEWACEAEADCYFLFNTLMVEMRDVFVPDLDEADTGIQGRISNFVTLLSLHDPEVRCHLDDIGIDASFYAIRWLTTLLSREFLLPDTIRLWDSMFASTHKDNFLRYVCVTMVMIIRDKLLASDFSTCLRLLQSYPPTNIDRLLESSRALWIYESQITLACHKGGISLQMALNTITPPSGIIMAYGLMGGVAMDPARRLRAAGEKMVSDAKKVVKEDYEGMKSASKSLFGNVGRRSWWLGR